jgi:hypothetical protein
MVLLRPLQRLNPMDYQKKYIQKDISLMKNLDRCLSKPTACRLCYVNFGSIKKMLQWLVMRSKLNELAHRSQGSKP